MQSLSLIRGLIVALMVTMLAACSSEQDPRYIIPAQKWQDAVVEVQTRPAAIVPGINEVMILTTTERGRPLPDFIISLRVDQAKFWHQAIQDGFSGVYRRAVFVPADASILYVQLKKKKSKEVVELSFPVVMAGQ